MTIPFIITALIILVAVLYVVARLFPAHEDGHLQTYDSMDTQLSKMGASRRRYFQKDGEWFKTEVYTTSDKAESFKVTRRV